VVMCSSPNEFMVIYILQGGMIRVDFFISYLAHSLPPPPPLPRYPGRGRRKRAWETVHISLLNFTGVRCRRNTPRCRFFLDVWRKGREFREREAGRKKERGQEKDGEDGREKKKCWRKGKKVRASAQQKEWEWICVSCRG